MVSISREDTANKVIALVAEKLSIPDKGTLVEQTRLEDLGADSLDMVEIIMRLEEQFGIQIDDAAAQHINTLKDVIDVVYNLKSQAK